jgi:hypothetical protein
MTVVRIAFVVAPLPTDGFGADRVGLILPVCSGIHVLVLIALSVLPIEVSRACLTGSYEGARSIETNRLG